MSTRAKLYITNYTASIMMILNVFSKPLRIPEPLQFVLIFGAFIPIGMMFHYNKKLKQEKLAPAATSQLAPQPTAEPSKAAKNRLLLIIAIGIAIGLCAPFWMPLTGTTLGTTGDLICGLITAAIVCVISGLRFRKL